VVLAVLLQPADGRPEPQASAERIAADLEACRGFLRRLGGEGLKGRTEATTAVAPELGRAVALYHRSSTSYQIR
jgi:hypothetical protein